LIPETKQPAVARALKEAFGVTELEEIQQNMRTPRFHDALQIVSSHRPQR
jgi:hypothetical protein